MMDNEPSFHDYLSILSKRRRWIVAAVLLSVGVAAVLTYRTDPVYEAEAKLFVGQRQIRVADVEEARSLNELSVRLLQSYAAVLKTHPIARIAIQRDALPHDPVGLADDLQSDPIVDTQLIRLRYRSTDPGLAKRTVNSVARAFVDEIEKIDARLDGSRSREEPAVRVSIVEPALRPRAPVGPSAALNFSLAIVIGVLIGIGSALLIENLDATVKGKEEAELSANAPVLAGIPKIRTRTDEIYLEENNQSLIAEAYRKLRTSVQLHDVGNGAQVILVTSPAARDGKTTIATNLAAVYAHNGTETLILEADLRRPRLHDLFGEDGDPGLASLLLGQAVLADAIVETSIPNLHCLPAAAIPANPVELLCSDQMTDVMTRLRKQFHTIVIDAPPILPVADAANLVSHSDGVVLIALTKRTRGDRLADAAEQVRKAGGRLLGVVLNAVPTDRSGGDYYSYSAYRRSPRGANGLMSKATRR